MVSDTRSIDRTADPDADALPTWLRPVVYAFLAVFVACGLFSIEVWPLSGFRLYSAVRGEERTSHAIVATLDDGSDRLVRFRELPLGWRNTNLLVREFDTMTQAERDEVCAAWVEPLEDGGLDVVRVEVHEVVTHLAEPDRPSERVGTPYTCEL